MQSGAITALEKYTYREFAPLHTHPVSKALDQSTLGAGNWPSNSEHEPHLVPSTPVEQHLFKRESRIDQEESETANYSLAQKDLYSNQTRIKAAKKDHTIMRNGTFA